MKSFFKRVWASLSMVDRIFIVSAFIVLILICLSGCAETRKQQTDTVTQEDKHEEYIIPPLTINTPAGTITSEPATLTKVTKATINTNATLKEQKEIAPSPAAIQTVTSFGGILTGLITGGITTGLPFLFAFLKKNRQLNETIDGVEDAKMGMDLKNWEHLTGKMAARHSADTQKVIRNRTA